MIFNVLVSLSAISSIFLTFANSGAMVLNAIFPALWFPMNEWNASINIGSIIPSLALALSYKLGPLLVSEPGKAPVEVIEKQYFEYTYLQTGVSIFGFLVVLAYFPSKPKLPPTLVAEEERTPDPKEAILTILKSRDFWIIMGRCCTIPAIAMIWMSLLSIFLGDLGLDQNIAGSIGLISMLVVIPVQVILGYVADWTHTHLKAIIVTCSLLALQGATWIFLIYIRVLPYSVQSMFAASLIYIIASGAPSGLQMENLIEVMFPISEGTVIAGQLMVQTLANISTPTLIPHISVNWFIGTLIGFGFTLALPNKYNRSATEMVLKQESDDQLKHHTSGEHDDHHVHDD